MVWPEVAGDARDRGDADDPAVVVDQALLEQLGGDPLGRGQVDRDDRVPAVLGHVGELLVAGDAGVVHDDVDAAELVLDVLGDPLRRVLGGDVECELVAVELAHHGLQLAGGLGHVDAEDGGAVAVQHPGDLLADAAARAGDDGDLAGQWPGPVRDVLGDGGGAVRPDPDHLAGDVGGLRRQQERQRRGERAVGRRHDVHELGGAAAADLLAERAGEALERALGDAFPSGVRGLRRSAQYDETRACLEAAQQWREELLQVGELLGGGDAGGVEDQALVLLALGGVPCTLAMPSSSSAVITALPRRPLPPTATVPVTSGSPSA